MRTLIVFLGITSGAFAQAQPFCAFEVAAKSPAGRPIAGLDVVLFVDPHTPFSQTKTDANGAARICDAPLGVVHILVGHDMYGSVQLRFLRQTWGETQKFVVVHRPVPYGHFQIDDHCKLLLRVRDESGQAVQGARLAAAGTTSDVFGRIFVRLKKGERIHGAITTGALTAEPLALTCGAEGTAEVERTLILR